MVSISSDAKRKANARYLAKQEEFRIRMQPGLKGQIADAATRLGMSMNTYILEAIAARLDKEQRSEE